MKITILTLFPAFFESPLQSSMLKRAQEHEAVTIDVVDIRAYATDKHKVTDDRPYGGGPGMVMKVEPIDRALQAVTAESSAAPYVVLTSAQGKPFTQEVAEQYAQLDHLVVLCGHYEGVDERVTEHLVDEEVRIGEYVLTGGEPAALVMVDAVTRLLPGVLGNESSNQGESHSEPGMLGFPQYTRPETYNGWNVPDVLLSGDHAQIESWREQQRKHLTAEPEPQPEE